MTINGRLTQSELAPIGRGLYLANNAATGWLAMVVAAAKDGVDLWPAEGNAPAYRDYDLQSNISGLNPDSGVQVASAGFSTHGWGTRIDIGSFGPRFGADGSRRRSWLLEHAHKFGFKREFGENDPNHFAHDNVRRQQYEIYRLDWDEMATQAEVRAAAKAGTIDALQEKFIVSEVSGNKVSVAQVIGKMHLNLYEINEREKAAEQPEAPATQ